jgi:hypothetical protein
MFNIKLFPLVFLGLSALAQRPTGAIFDPTTIASTPQKVEMSLRSFRGLPAAASLEKYCPTPGDQGNFGTCVAFANGYGIATILYAKSHNITDKNIIDKYAFSPTFLYEQIKDVKDNNCQNGADPIKAILTMMNKGEAMMRTVPYSCGAVITDGHFREASQYKVGDASILFAKGVKEYDKTDDLKITLTKKALAEGSPVSVGFHLPETFFRIKTSVWTPDPNEEKGDWKHNGHAMAIVGYDDNMAGGSFRILNSWGSNWADNGYVWIRYADYTKWCILALQVFGKNDSPIPDEVKPQPKPEPKPQPSPEPPAVTFKLSGSVEFKLNTGDDMPIKQTSTRNLTVDDDVQDPKEDLVAYTMAQSYTSGTGFRFYLNIDNEAYVYALATDLTGKVNKILPFKDNVSTHVGANSVIAFPSDTKVVRLDEQKGTDYLLILYSAAKLDLNEIVQKMNGMSGALSTKIKVVLGDRLIDKEKITYLKDKVGFSTTRPSTRNLTVDDDQPNAPVKGSVVPLMVEINHN